MKDPAYFYSGYNKADISLFNFWSAVNWYVATNEWDKKRSLCYNNIKPYYLIHINELLRRQVIFHLINISTFSSNHIPLDNTMSNKPSTKSPGNTRVKDIYIASLFLLHAHIILIVIHILTNKLKHYQHKLFLNTIYYCEHAKQLCG